MQALRYQQPKLLRYAQELMNDPKLSWRESVKTFLKNCCYGEKVGFAVLSIEEEQQVYRCLSNENFQAFRNDQLYLYRNLGQFTRNYTQTTKRGLLTTNKG